MNLAEIGEALYGPQWVTPLARALGVSERSVRYWRRGSRIPDSVWEDLPVIAALRHEEIDAAINQIGRE